jgi:hypothetical protein
MIRFPLQSRKNVVSLIAHCALATGILAIAPLALAADPAGGIADKPLAARSFTPGKTMFVQLSPEQTGVRTENNFADPKMKGALYQEFETSSVGTGVAVGDYDGDGKPDIFVVSKTESCRLFRNLGDWKFEDVTDKAGVGDKGDAAMVWKQGATFADVNNDGLLDIYVCRYDAPNLLYINQGDGTFKEMAREYGLDVKDSSVMAAFCDYDRDGWLDVYIAVNILNITAHPNGQRGYLFRNNRNGTFTNVTQHAGIYGEKQSHSATWWDYDNDGWPDLYVAYDYGAPDNLYHNNRDGTFTDANDQTLPHTSFSSMGSDLGDVNNDGLIDFLVADMASTTHQKDHHMTADFRARTAEIPDGAPTTPKYHRNALLLNTGTSRALEAGFLADVAATDWTWSIRLEDLDNDGRLDVVVTNGFPRDPSVDVVRKMQRAETPAERIRIMYATPKLAEVHHSLRNLGDLRFENSSADWGLDQKDVSFGAAFGDFGGDGNLDLVYSNYHEGVTFLRNQNETGHRVNIDLRGTISNRFGVGATVRIESALGIQASQLALSRGYMSSSEPMIHFGLGADTVIKRLTVSWPSGHVQEFQNLPVDRRFTITEPSTPPPSLSAPKPFAGGQFTEVGKSTNLAFTSREEPVAETAGQLLLPLKLNRRGPSLAVAELDSGTSAIVAIGGTTQTRASILTRTATGAFAEIDSAALMPISSVDDGPLLFLDANGDGKEDLLVTKGGNALPSGATELQPKLYLGDGKGGFRPAPDGALPALTTSIGAVAAADFEHSGRLGVFLGGRVLTGQYPYAPTSALWANHDGKFEDVTDTAAPGLREAGMVTAALWSDVDGDGWVDLLLTLEWGGVKYFHNNGGKGLDDQSEKAGFAAAGAGWWTSIAAADFNGDGRMDYVAGNLGLNTQYHADAGHPALLFSGDFKGDGTTQLIEGYYEGDKLYPWRTLRDLGAAVPSVLKRYPRWDQYERATLGEILGEDKLAKADRFAATEFSSGVFLSQSDGTYHFEPLPRIAQISPFQGLVTGDFNGDGHADIYTVQNSYAPITPVGRFDGGLSQLLLGDGHGHFTPATPRESGLVVSADAKALAVLDLDQNGWPDFLVSRNNNTTLAFRNNAVAGHHPLRIILRGPAGNPTAVGARITISFADGSTETNEVYAGSGYYSQSTAACFFGYTQSNPPAKIQVRWPGGAVSEQKWSGNSSTVVLEAPAA